MRAWINGSLVIGIFILFVFLAFLSQPIVGGRHLQGTMERVMVLPSDTGNRMFGEVLLENGSRAKVALGRHFPGLTIGQKITVWEYQTRLGTGYRLIHNRRKS